MAIRQIDFLLLIRPNTILGETIINPHRKKIIMNGFYSEQTKGTVTDNGLRI